MPSLLTVPREIRELIYQYTLSNGQQFTSYYKRYEPKLLLCQHPRSVAQSIRSKRNSGWENVDPIYHVSTQQTYIDDDQVDQVSRYKGIRCRTNNAFRGNTKLSKTYLLDDLDSPFSPFDNAKFKCKNEKYEHKTEREGSVAAVYTDASENSLLYTCRLIRDEASQVWFGTNTFYVRDEEEEVFMDYLDSRSDLSKACIKKVALGLTSFVFPMSNLGQFVSKFKSSETNRGITLLKDRPTALFSLPNLSLLDLEAEVGNIDSCKWSPYLSTLLENGWFKDLPECARCIIRVDLDACHHCKLWRKRFGDHIYAKRQRWEWIRVHGSWTIVRHIGSNPTVVTSLNDNILGVFKELSRTEAEPYAIIIARLRDLMMPAPISSTENETDNISDVVERLLTFDMLKPKCENCGIEISRRDMIDCQCDSCELVFFCETCRNDKPRNHLFNCIKMMRSDEERAVLRKVKELVRAAE